MPKGPTKRRPQTLARLLDAAREVFAEAGFQGAGIEDICRRAGYTRGAFYSNFRTKDELFFALFDAHADRELGRIARTAAEIGDDDLTVGRIAEVLAYVDPDERTWFLVTTEFTLYAVRDPRAARMLADHDARLRAEAVRLLRDLFERAGLRPTVDLDELVRVVIAMREGALGQSYVEPERLMPGALARRFLPLLLAAATTAADAG
ncbi:TetR family transcriptional regulator [Streptomyces agglomeratus]|uniref:TetR family transcriptional regulator n=1 Tax=Streptomyces agglomeratus TaxID=285458 RepID=A0A1E5PF34_9ACTN|nr:TetR/AcrR family transcriptional regulator [Streptomyces agglomeratus]OEJ28141.1 TetR family transcriptional regulator [Streptomyces agglomeratus]OEJ37797.1 TetR family transcriptional regulator [Streptomyces agglomeratus]OEJ47819.1 TetR family transcriptional regulator [Streptomyces agglomeratus]OEJ50333.1 TetR family transcriptional regulator [Streptomyces agglomeratus]OEJ57660.1 TetR family transcriptional regulator [Streptomyces agglomeratus]